MFKIRKASKENNTYSDSHRKDNPTAEITPLLELKKRSWYIERLWQFRIKS